VKALYVTDRRAIGDERLEVVLRQLAGAPDLTVQVREKASSDRECLHWARRARALLGPDVPLYVNRRFDLALAAGAQGVHLPADGLPLGRVRTNTPRGFGVGVSTHSAAEAERAIQEGADLVILGPIFDTPSKRGAGEPLSPRELEGLPLLADHSAQVFAIGGIREETLSQLLPYRDRISGIAAIRLFQDSEEPARIARTISRL
jgi:thiamine-phosphate pyrophosphorylase